METIKKGSRGEAVKNLQQLLGINADGIFGAGTAAALVEWQAMHGLKADGICGPATWAALESSAAPTKLVITKNPINIHITKKKRDIKYIVLHFTAGANSKKGSANTCRNVWLKREASADFAVDDETILQINPDLKNYYCWSVGDGKGAYGITNTNSVSIEMCSTLQAGTSPNVPNHSGWSISQKVLDKTADLVRYLMKEFNIPKERVVRHYDASRKSCPGVLGWNDGTIYDAKTGKKTTQKNNSSKWKEWHDAL